MDKWEYIFGAVIVVAVIWVTVFLVRVVQADVYCLRHGWAESKVTVTFEQFCIREENEYEIVKPLAEVRREVED